MTPDIVLHKKLKAALKARGVSFTYIAKELGRTTALVSLTCMGRTKSHPVQSKIAEHLGRKPEEIWPDRYPEQEEGMP